MYFDRSRDYAVRGIENMVVGDHYIKVHVPETNPYNPAEVFGPNVEKPVEFVGVLSEVGRSGGTPRLLFRDENGVVRAHFSGDDGIEAYSPGYYNTANWTLHVEGLAAKGVELVTDKTSVPFVADRSIESSWY